MQVRNTKKLKSLEISDMILSIDELMNNSRDEAIADLNERQTAAKNAESISPIYPLIIIKNMQPDLQHIKLHAIID